MVVAGVNDSFTVAGMPDVFAHGVGHGYLGQALPAGCRNRRCVPTACFASITWVGNELTYGGTVTEKFEEDGEKRVRLEVKAADQDGDIKLIGEAVVALD